MGQVAFANPPDLEHSCGASLQGKGYQHITEIPLGEMGIWE